MFVIRQITTSVKRILIMMIYVSCFLLTYASQYNGYDLIVTSITGESKKLGEYINFEEGQVTFFVFWKTCCPTNLNMIDSLLELYDDYEDSKLIRIFLVSVDDSRSTDRVIPVVKTKGWKSDVIIDNNMELARFMSVYTPPQWVAVDNQGKTFFRRKIMEGESDAEYYFNELITEINNDI